MQNKPKNRQKTGKNSPLEQRIIAALFGVCRFDRFFWINNFVAFSFAVISVTNLTFFPLIFPETKAALGQNLDSNGFPKSKLITLQDNTLLPLSRSINFKMPEGNKMEVLITGYSSTTWQTDDDPFVTAAGTMVRDGIVANNLLPFGTKIRIPELYPNKIFDIEDRMNWEKNDNHIDIWFDSYEEALHFGVKNTYIEVLE